MVQQREDEWNKFGDRVLCTQRVQIVDKETEKEDNNLILLFLVHFQSCLSLSPTISKGLFSVFFFLANMENEIEGWSNDQKDSCIRIME